MLPPRIRKEPKRESRWRSPSHCNFVRSHACCKCGSTAGIEVAHYRIGSGAGMSQKPDDFRTLSLCRDCHRTQHTGERSFWSGTDVDALIEAFIKASPKRQEIDRIRKERARE